MNLRCGYQGGDDDDDVCMYAALITPLCHRQLITYESKVRMPRCGWWYDVLCVWSFHQEAQSSKFWHGNWFKCVNRAPWGHGNPREKTTLVTLNHTLNTQEAQSSKFRHGATETRGKRPPSKLWIMHWKHWKHSTPCTTEFCFVNFNITVFVELRCTGLWTICLVVNNTFIIIMYRV